MVVDLTQALVNLWSWRAVLLMMLMAYRIPISSAACIHSKS